MIQLYKRLVSVGNLLQPFFLFAIRLFWGYSFFTTGLGKLLHISQTETFFRSLHIPFPLFHSYLVGGIECIGGVCFVLGLGSRLVAIPLAISMCVALFAAHSHGASNVYDNLQEMLIQPPFTYMFVSLVIFFFGPGLFSLDAALERWFTKSK